MLIIAIIDTILDTIVLVLLCLELQEWADIVETQIILFLVHLAACILLAVSMWEHKMEYVTPYLLTAVFRNGYVLRFIIYAFYNEWALVGAIYATTFVIGCFFWACAWAWYSKLKNDGY
ncbi:hypothetical protein ACLKA6_012360 [Drosophila palustris]